MRAARSLGFRSASLPLGFAAVVLVLGGCAAVHDGAESTVRPFESPAVLGDAVQDRPIRRNVKTVKPQGATEAPRVEAAETPSPKEIFDFHPAGSQAGSWRQPFDIDINDGPLAAEVHKTAAELKAFNAERKTGLPVIATKPCSETDVAHAKPGCLDAKPKIPPMISRDPLALQ